MQTTSYQNTYFIHNSDFSGDVIISQRPVTCEVLTCGRPKDHDLIDEDGWGHTVFPLDVDKEQFVRCEIPGEALLYLVEQIVRDKVIAWAEQATLDELIRVTT